MFKEELCNDPVDSVFIQFICPYCENGGDVYDELRIPKRDWKAGVDDIGSLEPIEFTCPNCGHKFTGEISASATCSKVFINELDGDWPVLIMEHYDDEEYSEDDFLEVQLSNEDPFITFESSMKELEALVMLPKQDYLVMKMIYNQIATCVEAYLRDTAIKEIHSNPEYAEELKAAQEEVEFDIEEDEADWSCKAINMMAFYDFEKVGALYEQLFDIDFDTLAEVSYYMSHVFAQRDYLIHCNGLKMDGEEVWLDDSVLRLTYDEAYNFIRMLDALIRGIDPTELND